MCKFKEQRTQRVWVATKLPSNDGPSAAAEQSERKVLTVGAWWGLGQMPLGGSEFFYFYTCMYSHFSTASLFSSSLDLVSSTLGYGLSRAGWCPWFQPPHPQWFLHSLLPDLPIYFIIWKMTFQTVVC